MKKITAMTGTFVIFLLISGCNSTGCKNPADCYRKGLQTLSAGKRDEAYKYLAKAANDDPSNVNYQWTAARAAPNPKFALFHVKTAWDNGLRNEAVFEAYLELSRINEPSQSPFFALQLYKQLPDSIRTEDLRAGIFFSYKMYDSTLAILLGLFKTKPSPDLTNSIAKVYLAKNQNDKASALLIESRNAKLLNKDGYLLLNLAFLRTFDYMGCASVFESAKENGLYDGEFALAHARGLVAQEKFNEAENLLKAQLKAPDEGKNSEILKNNRSVLAFIYFTRGDVPAILALEGSVLGGTGEADPEKTLFKTMAKRISDTATIIPVLTDLFKKMPAYPEVQIILAQELTRAGKNAEALKVYQNLPDVYLGAPRIIIERARLLDRCGKSVDALAMLSFLHSGKIMTKSSLELFRDISFKKNSIEDAAKAQKILEKAYKNDVSVRWAKGVMYLKDGKSDSAISVFSALRNEFPKEPRFYLVLLSAWFNDEKYEKVIKECSADPSNEVPVLRLLARSYVKRALPAQADSVYRIAIETDKKDAGMGMEYAEFLLHNKNPVKAAEVYRSLIDKKTGALGSDTGKSAAIALNNLAWSLLQTEGADKETVLSAIKKAYSIDKNSSSIIDTYAEALLKFERYDECVELLENNRMVNKSGDLLVRLADAYEKSGKDNKAVRTLQEAEKLFDTDRRKKDAIQKRITTIIARK